MIGQRDSLMSRLGVLALALVGVLTLASCAEEDDGGTAGSEGSGSGEGLEHDATIEEYKEAFADVEPIQLTTQSPSPKGSVTGRNVEDYFNAITEWSDGKITFEIAFSNAIAPVTEVDNALLDGRLDVGQVLPIYEPAEFPANAALIEAGFISNQSAVAGTLQSNAWPNEVAFATPEIMSEFEDKGMKVLMPIYNSGANVLFCSTQRRDLASLNGMQAASGGQAQSAQIEALGGSPASVAYPELFESLQRGVVDCSVSSMTVGVLGGFIQAAPHVVVDEDAGFALAPGAMAISQTTWDSLPLVAQQLFWDRLDVFMEVNIEGKIWPNTVDAVKQAKAAGGSVGPFAEDARKALNDANEKLLDGIRGNKALDGDKLVDDSQEAADTWLAEVEEVGITDEVPYEEFDTWYADGKVEVGDYVDKLFEEVFLPQRPS